MKEKNLIIIQGNTFEWLIPILDVNGKYLDMSGYVGGTAGARGMIRKKAADAEPAVTFNITIVNKTGILSAIEQSLFHATDAEIEALEPDLSGKCYLLVRVDATTSALIAKGTYLIYDIEIEDTYGFVDKPFTGTVVVKAESTK